METRFTEPPRFPALSLRLPSWVEMALPPVETVFPRVEDRMELVLRLAAMNVRHGTGGPFGAAVFNLETHTLIAPGVNSVVPAHCSLAHAEMLALSLAQAILQTHDLGAPGVPATELVASTEPCSMCLGALPWAGIRALVCGARDEDARTIGFDEGPKATDWVEQLESRGIRVTRDVHRRQAADILHTYLTAGGLIYNGRSGPAAKTAP